MEPHHMTKITIRPRILDASAETVFDWLSDFRNFEPLMPDAVKDWQASPSGCKLKLGALGPISMEQKKLTRPSELLIGDAEGKPFPFSLIISIKEIDASHSEVGMSFEAKLNPFLKMMVEKPLEGFLGHLLKTAQQKLAAKANP